LQGDIESKSQPSSANSQGAGQSTAPKEKESGYLDIPAFLRRQAD